MRPRILSAARLSLPLATALAALLVAPNSHASTFYWDTDGATAGSGGTTPSGTWSIAGTTWSTDSTGATATSAVTTTVLDNLFFSAGTDATGLYNATLDANQAARNLTFEEGAVTLLGNGTARTLTLGTGGITMASGTTVTLGDGSAANDVLISLAKGAQTWTNNSANNLTFNTNAATFGSRTAGSTLVFNQVGAGNFAVTSGVSIDATGIIGPWAFFGTGTSQRYATVSAGNIIGYTGGTAAADANAFISATTNYDLTSAAVTLSGSRTANTFRSAGAGGAISLGASGTNSLTLNGILAVGTLGTLTINDSGSTGTVVVGSSNELVIAGSQNVTIDTQITAGAGKTLTYAGTGTLNISGTNGSSSSTFTGNLNVLSGTFTNTSSQTFPNGIDVTTFIAAGATYNHAGAFGAALNVTKPWTVNGTLNKTGNGSSSFSSTATISGTGTINISSANSTAYNANNSNFTGTISDSSSQGFTLGHNGALGAGTFIFGPAVSSTVANFLNPNVTAIVFPSDPTFSGSNNMNLGVGAVTLSGGNRILTVTGVTVTLGGAVGQDVPGRALTKAGTGNLVLTGSGSSYTGATVISAGGLDLGGGTATGSLASPTLTLGGGTFSYTRTGTNTQSFTTTNFNSSPANVLTVASGNTLNLGNIVRATGAYYDFSTIPGGGTVAAATSSNVGGIMSSGFTFGGNTWAVANGAGVAISGLSTYTLTSVAGTTGGNYTGNNIDVDNSAGILSAGITTNSIRFSSAAANTMTLTGANVISTGGILVASTVGSNLSTITGGTSLTGPASGELVIRQNNPSGGLTIGSNIINSGTTPLSKLGAGTLTLSGTNTYTGTTTVYQGTLAVSGGAAIANTGLVTLANTAGVTFQLNSNETIGNLSGGGTTGGTVALGANTLTVGDGNAQTYSGNFTGTSASSIIKQGSQTLTLAATSLPGTATINAGMLAFNSTTTVSGGTITLGANTSGLLFNGGASAGVSGMGGVTISNNIVLGNSVTTTGARLWASGNQGRWNFTGGITGAAGAAGAQTLLFDTRAGGTVGGDRTATTISGVIANGNQALNLNIAITPQSGSSGSANHPAYVNLTGANTFTGSITATRGNAAGATSWLVIGGERWSDGPNNTPTYGRMGSGRLGENAGGVYAGNFALGGTTGTIVNLDYFSSANQTWSGTIGTGGLNNNGALVKEGTGTLTLTGASTYNSLTTIGGGTLALAFNTGVTTSNILPSTTPLWMGLGTIYDPITANADMTISGGGGGTLQLGGTAASATQTVASLNTATNTASSIVVGANRTLTITSGTITIGTNSGLNFNTSAGGNSGATVGTSIVAFGGAPTAFTSGFTVTDSTGFGLAAVNVSNQVIRNTSTTLLPGTTATSSATDYRIDNNGGGSGADGSSSLAITTSRSTKSITVDTTTASGVLTLNSGVVLSNSIWNFGAASGSNTYQITGSTSGAGVRTTATGETFVINNFNAGAVTFNSPILAFGTNALVVGGTGTVSLAGLNTFTGATTINSGVLQISGSGRLNAGTYAGAIGINGGSVLQYSSDQAQTLSGVISGPGGITKDTGASSILTLSATNLYTGPTTVNAGTLRAGAAAGAQAFGGGSAVTLANTSGVTLDLNSFSQTIGSLAGGGTTGGNVSLGTATLTAGGNNASTTFGGVISSVTGGGLTKNGIGTMTLSGASGYTGATTISGGTLQLTTGSLTGTASITNNANLTVNRSSAFTQTTDLNNKAINGTGSFTQAGAGSTTLTQANNYTGATLVSAGTLLVNGSLGNSAVTVNGGAFGGSGTIGSTLNLLSGSFHVVDLFDAMQVSGTVTLYAGFGIDDLAGLTWGSVADGTYTLIDGTLTAGVFAGLTNNSLGTAYDIGGGRSAYFQEGSLQLVVIPEPRAALLGGLGLLALLRRRRA